MNLQEKRVAIEQRHRAAVRWEKLRAAYFTRTRNPIQAERCNLLALEHENALDQVGGEARQEAPSDTGDVARAKRKLGWS